MGTPTALRKLGQYLTGTSFANNTTGAITAQMVRQFTESGMGGYATICAKAGTPASQAVASTATATIDWNAEVQLGLMVLMIQELCLQQP